MVSTQIINAVRNYTDDALRAVKNAKIRIAAVQMNSASFGLFLSDNDLTFTALEPKKNYKNHTIFTERRHL